MPSTDQCRNAKAMLAEMAERINIALDQRAAPADAPAELAEAMRYAVMGSGKRIRPALVLLSADAAAGDDTPPADPIAAAVAIEYIHCYSLVHDDLPAMDDDDLRRGRPTVHVKYDPAMAILVGDALLTQAFAVLAEMPAAVAAALTAELARAAGSAGMIAGQVADMALCRIPEGRAGLEYIHARKTGALISAATRLGAICGGGSAKTVDLLGTFGMELGLAFQVMDDLLDVTATSEQLGKTAGKDDNSGKRTYPNVLGVDASRKIAATLTASAQQRLTALGPAAEPLADLTAYMLERKN